MNAAGCNIINNDIPGVIKELNEKLAKIKFEPKYDIDYIVTQDDESWYIASQILDVNRYKYIWGRGCEEPLILVKDYVVAIDKIRLLARGTLRFDLTSDISAIKFHASEEEYEKLICQDNGLIKLNIVGRCTVNKWNGREYAQIEVVDYDFVPYQEQQLQKQKEVKQWVF